MKDKFFNLFLPLAYILFAALISQNLINDSGRLIINHIDLSPNNLLILQISAGIISLIPSILLIVMSMKYSVKKIIKSLYGFSAITASLFFFVLLPYHDFFVLPVDLVKSLTPYLEHEQQLILANHWHTIIFYGLAVLWPSGMILLLYGYMNDIFSFKKAAKFYPLFGVLALLFNIFINPLCLSALDLSPTLKAPEFPQWLYRYGGAIMFFLVSSYACYIHMFRKKVRLETAPTNMSGLSWSYASGLGILAGFSGIIILFTKTIWKYNARIEFPSPSEYAHHLGSFGMYSSIAALMTLGVLVFMSFCLEERLAKGWRNFYFAISFMTLILGATFFVFTVFDNSITPLVTPKHSITPLRSLTLISAGYQILVSSIAYPVILSLKEIAIVPIERKKRFTAKLLIDLVFVKGFLILGAIITSILRTYTGSIKASFPYMMAIFFVLSLSRFAFIYFLGCKLDRQTQSIAVE
ncbi:MAG: Npt1/Npt2 family nucleotide transporter [Chlamydiota bacterium]|nr:Npt1/Npt2 family nucleotide transporter [Chlamydiota bacterium]